jgi:hypothetical protein
MRKHRERGGGFQVRIKRAIDLRHDTRDGRDPILEAGEDRLLAPLAMHDIGPDHALRRLHPAAMRR